MRLRSRGLKIRARLDWGGGVKQNVAELPESVFVEFSWFTSGGAHAMLSLSRRLNQLNEWKADLAYSRSFASHLLRERSAIPIIITRGEGRRSKAGEGTEIQCDIEKLLALKYWSEANKWDLRVFLQRWGWWRRVDSVVDVHVSEENTASIFSPEDGDDKTLRNGVVYQRVCSAPKPKRASTQLTLLSSFPDDTRLDNK